MPGSIGKHFPHPLNKKHIRIFRRVLPGVQPWLEESARFYAAEQPESRSGLHVPKYHQVVFQWGSTWIFWETHPENRKKTPRFNGNTSIELKHGKIKKRVVQQQKPKQVWRSYGLWCLDITYGVFFRNRISASICLTFPQFSILSPLCWLPQIWFDVGWQWKKQFWATVA